VQGQNERAEWEI
jgi:hypothetical protein